MAMLKTTDRRHKKLPLKGKGSSFETMLFFYLKDTLPAVKQRLKYWIREAEACPDPELRCQALSSLRHKAFHCLGGAVYSLPYAEKRTNLLNLIIAYQTLCDYLDNLCDRVGCMDEKAFALLHQSLLAALDPDLDINTNYYAYYPCCEDGGYIKKLILACRQEIEQLPSYPLIKGPLLELVSWYCTLQVKKHIALTQREGLLKQWAEAQLTAYPGLLWQEFAAASGSTLALFALWGLASRAELNEEMVLKTVQGYFPWICGLHILLDYFIDQEEDRQGEDLNFIEYYENNAQLEDRLKLFIQAALYHGSQLSPTSLDLLVVNGLLAMYLSDPKIKEQGLRHVAKTLLQTGGRRTRFTYQICQLVRLVHAL